MWLYLSLNSYVESSLVMSSDVEMEAHRRHRLLFKPGGWLNRGSREISEV